MDSPLEESKSRCMETIKNGLLIGQKQPLVDNIDSQRARIEWSRCSEETNKGRLTDGGWTWRWGKERQHDLLGSLLEERGRQWYCALEWETLDGKGLGSFKWDRQLEVFVGSSSRSTRRADSLASCPIQPWVSYLASLCLCFLILKMNAIIPVSRLNELTVVAL